MDSKFLHYNALDAACTFEVRNAIWSDLEQDNLWAYSNTMSILEPIMYMQSRGIKVDHTALQQTKVQVTQRMQELQEELNRIVGKELNVNSPKQMQTYFYIDKGIQPYIDRSTGSITCDDLALARIARGTAARKGLREASLAQEIRGLGKLVGTYLDIEFDADGRMHCSYKLRGTKMGRLSSTKTIYGTGTNNQNLPAEFKKFLVADEGCCFVEFDKRQAEWVVVAYLAQDANMLDVIQNNRDPHTHTAHLMFGVPAELIKMESKLIGSSSDQDFIAERRQQLPQLFEYPFLPRSFSLRQTGKKSNHGLNYDEGYRGFALINEMPEADAKRVVELYHTIYPNIRQQYYANVKADLQRNRTLENCFGRRFHFLDAWGDSLFKSAYSFQPQSTVVDSLNMGMKAIYDDQSPAFSDTELLAQVHDSVLIQFPLSKLPLLHTFISQSYDYLSPELEYYGNKFKIATDTKIGLNWGTYDKVHNPNGMKEIELCPDKDEMLQRAQLSLGV